MADPSRDRALDHVVVVMFENRSFDNLLGRLYHPDEVRSFEGALGKELSNPIPEWAEHAYNTVLMVNFDKHGGTYDHVPPPAAPPPDPGAPRGQMDFAFDRSGVRIPAIAISPWIPERTVVNDEFRNTSVLHTMRERWSLGAPFSAREAIAPSLRSVATLDTPRPPEDWPNLEAQPVPAFDTKVVPADRPLGGLGKALFLGLLALAKEIGQTVPEIVPDRAPTGSEAVAIMRDLFGHMFPNLQGST